MYLGILEKIFNLKDLSEHGKINDIPERDIYSSVVFAKNFEEMMKKSKSAHEESVSVAASHR